MKQWNTRWTKSPPAAGLAYIATMMKVQFNERTNREKERRKTLGIFVRFEFALDVLEYEANNLLEQETDPPKSSSETFLVVVDDLALSKMPEIKEAWENLDYFPVTLYRQFYEIQNELYNFAQFKKDHAGKIFLSEYGMTEHEMLVELREILKELKKRCTNALAVVRREIPKLQKREI
jgi:hypothetical protein